MLQKLLFPSKTHLITYKVYFFFRFNLRLIRGRTLCPTSLWAIRSLIPALPSPNHWKQLWYFLQGRKKAGPILGTALEHFWRNCWSSWIILISCCFKNSRAILFASSISNYCAGTNLKEKQHKSYLWKLQQIARCSGEAELSCRDKQGWW